MPSPSSLQRAAELLRRTPLVDGHNDLAWAHREQAGYDLGRLDVGTRLASTHTDLPRLREGGVGAQFWSVYVPSTLSGEAAVLATLEQVDFVRRMVAAYPDDLAPAASADDIARVFASGRIASLLGAEGGHSIGESLAVLRQLYALGVRYLTLTHNDNVSWADSATDEPRLGGLSPFGREVVTEMNRLGMLVDLSHVAVGTMNDALDTSEAPVIFSHSSCRALVDHPRNVPDDVLRRLADNGGVCMVAFVPVFVSAAPTATVADVADHVEHARAVAGLDHVGLAGDYDGCDVLPTGLEDVTGYPRLIAELIDRGWSDDDCAKVAGGNILRVLAEAEAVAARAQKERAPATTAPRIAAEAPRPDVRPGR